MKEINTIKVSVNDLVKGKLYVDVVNNDNPERMAVLEFVEHDDAGPFFKQISGPVKYDVSPNGCIGFMSFGEEWDEIVDFE